MEHRLSGLKKLRLVEGLRVDRGIVK
ncbi:hypothetical protein A5844_002435 [Enterococcus sp. 10A9_DIV0425]|uniref:Uncharacterized protein n=1 Tax=Candidatus Enterococcus wittei TaxID=1987383 RepID=A0A242JWG1_9ENTE|nr:hypothetical protein A5844_002435 [Enterococcus sp. 10A9_DIV0425]